MTLTMLRGPSLCISVRRLGKSSIQFNEDSLQYKKAKFSDERTEEWKNKGEKTKKSWLSLPFQQDCVPNPRVSKQESKQESSRLSWLKNELVGENITRFTFQK